MKRVVFNIGLSAPVISPLDATKQVMRHGFTVRDTRIVKGQYNGEEERTLVLETFAPYDDITQVEDMVSKLAERLEQDCIAFVSGKYERLTYRATWEGERQEFDRQYFVDIEEPTKTGQVPESVGFSKTEGTVRQLTLSEQLRQRQHSGGTIKHPVHGLIEVTAKTARELMSVKEGHLIRFKRDMFN